MKALTGICQEVRELCRDEDPYQRGNCQNRWSCYEYGNNDRDTIAESRSSSRVHKEELRLTMDMERLISNESSRLVLPATTARFAAVCLSFRSRQAVPWFTSPSLIPTLPSVQGSLDVSCRRNLRGVRPPVHVLMPG